MKEAIKAFSRIFSTPGVFSDGAGFCAQNSVCVPSLTGSADAFLAAAMAGEGTEDPPRTVLAVTPGIPDAERLSEDLRVLGVKTLDFPVLAQDDKNALGTRIKTLASLRAWSILPYPCVVVAPFAALSSPIPENYGDTIEIDCGGKHPAFRELCNDLARFGYSRVPQVEQEGEYSLRGGIVDFWSPGEEFPFRAEFFGEELESLRAFDPATQISTGKAERCEIAPLEPESQSNANKSIFDILPGNKALLTIEHNEYPPIPQGGKLPTIYTGDPAPPGTATAELLTSALPGFSELDATQSHHPELFDAARRRLDDHLAIAAKRGSTIVKIDDLSGGFECKDLIVVTKADRVFSKKKTRSRRSFASGGRRLDDFNDLEPGEYVVHIDYGIGRYIGSSEISVDGKRSEVFTIEYADGGKLHVPSSHAHLLSRYIGVKGESVRMHRLDGTRWRKNKLDAERAVADLAASLLETQAKRETADGFAFDVQCDGIEAFEAAFAYEETPDQAAAIEDVKNDMARLRPMDRLVCGDAGYGKTEVAMRAAFIAAMNGKQVVLLAPTTVLAEQHFETFTSRFDGTPVRIESVSRFQSASTHEGTFQRIRSGVCDIVIGTHALLTGKTAFHDLGLIIIDEEQRFGVRHKEFLKRFKATADVLTLSATPIPRTLYLSMTGVRDMSLLRSPPRERVAVETKIVRDCDETVKAAISAELERGGQVYFLHNRVHTIGKAEKRIRSLCPQARTVTAHGQMDSKTLASKMRSFERGEYDILLSTTIIESGIDIPRANTILIDRADTFGMAELYQLRGRVGRSSKQGLAYFLLPPSGDVDSDARERLNALRRHGGLGAGFNLAVRDLELRGAGNLLGSQQSGHIAAVGFQLYCQLLKRTVSMLKGEKPAETIDVRLSLDFANPGIPSSYIEEDAQRFSLMKRFAEAQNSTTVKKLISETTDRFGPMPPETVQFVKCAALRIAASKAHISNIDVKDSRAVFYRTGSRGISFVETLRGRTATAKLDELVKMMRSRSA